MFILQMNLFSFFLQWCNDNILLKMKRYFLSDLTIQFKSISLCRLYYKSRIWVIFDLNKGKKVNLYIF